jgi:hypothetical protein
MANGLPLVCKRMPVQAKALLKTIQKTKDLACDLDWNPTCRYRQWPGVV